MAAFSRNPGLWNALIPKCDGLVAKATKACPAKSRIIPNQRVKSKKAKGKRGQRRLTPGLRLCLCALPVQGQARSDWSALVN
jgi:hypothetical protein